MRMTTRCSNQPLCRGPEYTLPICTGDLGIADLGIPTHGPMCIRPARAPASFVVDTGSREALPDTRSQAFVRGQGGVPRCAGPPPVLRRALQCPLPSHTGGGGQQGVAL